MITAKQTHAGQYRPYGDSYLEWEVTATEDTPTAEIVEWCFTNLPLPNVPPREEWQKQAGYGGPRHCDLAYYFSGYWEIQALEQGRRYKLTICEPYTD